MECAGLHHACYFCGHVPAAHDNLGCVRFCDWESSVGDRWLLLWPKHYDSDVKGIWPFDGGEQGDRLTYSASVFIV